MSFNNNCKESPYKKNLCLVQHDGGWDGLANAIILQAISDYKIASIRIHNNDFNQVEFNSIACNKYIKEVPRFLKSEYFDRLTKLDGKYLLETTNKILSDEYGVDCDELPLQRCV